jgi:hypothetical protein
MRRHQEAAGKPADKMAGLQAALLLVQPVP